MILTILYYILTYLLFMPFIFGFLSTAWADGYGKNRRWYIYMLAALWPASALSALLGLGVFIIIVAFVKICDGFIRVIRKLVELGEEWGRVFS